MGVGLESHFRGEVYGEVRFVIPYTYLQLPVPAVIVLNIMYTSIQFAVVGDLDREFGFLREVLVSPMPRPLVLLGKVLGGSTIATLHWQPRPASCPLCRCNLISPRYVGRSGTDVCSAFGLTSFGVLLAARVRSFEGFGVFSNTIILPLYFTSFFSFPARSIVDAHADGHCLSGVVGLSDANQPMTYAVDTLRG